MRSRASRLRTIANIAALIALAAGACSIETPEATVPQTSESAASPSPQGTPDNGADNGSSAVDPSTGLDEEAPAEGFPTAVPTITPAPGQSDAAPTPFPLNEFASSGLGDEYYPGLGNAGYDVEHYDLLLDFNSVDRTIVGQATIEMTTTQVLRSFNLDFTGLLVDVVAINGVPAAVRADGAGELVITPAEPLASGVTISVDVGYRGRPMPVPNAPFPGAGWIDRGSTVIVAGEPVGASGWYPVNDHPTDKATYTIKVIVDEGLEVASNGLLTDRIELDDGRVQWVWDTDDPQASYLTTLMIDAQ